MNDQKPLRERVSVVLKAGAIICALMLLALSIFNLGFTTLTDPIDIILPFYYVVFSIIMIGVEFNIQFVIRFFKFAEGFIGRGLFYIL
mmetsp:Transcript_26872/g.48440  ORF Transcript_26872/g.48440 Transcript_26872/m.48440 type:complete len:88 (-) Transcript_26872:186-449(-)